MQIVSDLHLICQLLPCCNLQNFVLFCGLTSRRPFCGPVKVSKGQNPLSYSNQKINLVKIIISWYKRFNTEIEDGKMSLFVD